jgi:branched-chain amino acid transport system permease protein
MAGIPQFHSPLHGFITDAVDSLLINMVFAGTALWLVSWIRTSRIGMLTKAVKFDENALSILGFRPLLIKVQVFAISALFAGTAGAMQAHYLGVVEPKMSSVYQTVLILCGTILSGSKSVMGSLLGASFLIVLPEILQNIFSKYFGTDWQVFPVVHIVYGVFIILVAFFLFPRQKSSLRYESDVTVTKC